MYMYKQNLILSYSVPYIYVYDLTVDSNYYNKILGEIVVPGVRYTFSIY